MNLIVTKLGHRLKVYGVTLRASSITTRQSTQHGHQNKKGYRVNNYE